ncbi:hypothetical protein KAF25_001376 [Fusarium avenaceum]|uniref:Heterokaryon incompatibility domain-containing protein n=1 Tax=Fusarium avenaceum TaxID=40199 RepID=A0A9P7H8K6_9HYPO|nr:hypothetical protein KAF25_001376 [Fusarium avenaceum]
MDDKNPSVVARVPSPPSPKFSRGYRDTDLGHRREIAGRQGMMPSDQPFSYGHSTQQRASQQGPPPGTNPLKNSTSEASDSQNVSRPSASAANRYCYLPLQHKSIRLVKILPGQEPLIKCEIVYATVEQKIPYTALSYAWGDPHDKLEIDLGGASIRVTVSLHGALHALRQTQQSTLVWADALCINQEDKVEQGLQIRLMPRIYSDAEFVAIWLGPEENNSTRAVKYLKQLATASTKTSGSNNISQLLKTGIDNGDILAVVSLFAREYWRRLWVVQEIFNAKCIYVYCGPTILPWNSYQCASKIFRQHRNELAFNNKVYGTIRLTTFPGHFSNEQILIHQGPASLPDLTHPLQNGEEALLHVLRTCRRKLASDPRDKVYGILGVLPTHIQKYFFVDYKLTVKDVYTGIVRFLLHKTGKLDTISEAIHFPVHTSSANVPTFVPDWSHIPQTSAMGFKYGFSSSGDYKAIYKFLDKRLNKLGISAIELDVVKNKGMVVGTLCVLGDYLMAFLHWRALVLLNYEVLDEHGLQMAEECLAATICLGQIPPQYDWGRWRMVCYHLFANLLRERLPYLAIDEKLLGYLDIEINVKPEFRRQILQQRFGDHMMGRCFCLTQQHRMAMGSGFMLVGDVIVVPLGCSTPILLRAEGPQGEYRYVGDIYVAGYMDGKAVNEWKDGKRELKTYVLH